MMSRASRALCKREGKGTMVFVYDHDGTQINEAEKAMRAAGFVNVYYVSDGWVVLRRATGATEGDDRTD